MGTTMCSLLAIHEHTWHFSGFWHAAEFLLLKSAAALLLPLRYLIIAPELRTSWRNVATRGDDENCPFCIMSYAMTTGVLSVYMMGLHPDSLKYGMKNCRPAATA